MKATIVALLTALLVAAQSAAAHIRRSNYEVARRAVYAVWGPWASQAMAVVKCETGGTYDVWAGYGKHQYWGLFQMGARERATYGHGWNAWAQARAAFRYFTAVHHSWGPWECKPY